MIVFSAEKTDGLFDVLIKNTSISYFSTIDYLNARELDIVRSNHQIPITVAHAKDDDLYFYKSILVSSSLNKNDDYFSPKEVWQAKDSPIDKPVNVEHDSTKVVGHQINCFAIDLDGYIIPNNTVIDELPTTFHLVVGSVLYKIWHSSEDYTRMVMDIIERIESGQLYVSQECRFRDFDYFLSKNNETKIVIRNEDTAFLTKYLKAYGGTGFYQDYKIARALKNISFIGKGLVSRPANPNSIILPKDNVLNFNISKNSKIFSFLEDSGVISSVEKLQTETLVMSEHTTANSDVNQPDVDTLLSDNKLLMDKLDVLTKELDAKLEQINVLTAQIQELTSQNQILYREKLELERLATLIDLGFSKDEARIKVELLSSLDDDKFYMVAKELVSHKSETKSNISQVPPPTIEDAKISSEPIVSVNFVSKDSDVSVLASKLSAELKTQIVDGEK